MERKKIVIALGGYDALTAKIVEKVGFEAFYMSGGATAMSFGLADVGFQSLTEMTMNIQRITSAVSIPVIADADTGFGNAIHATRCVREYIHAGAAAMHMEDQTFYKRCGNVAGKMLISLEEAVGKYRAAADTRDEYDPDFVIMARCDAIGAVGGGLDEGIRRGNAYADAGIDLIYYENLQSEEMVERLVKEVHAPVAYVLSGRLPRLSVQRMQELGIPLVIYSGVGLRAPAKGLWDYALALKEKGTQAYVDLEKSLKGHPLEDMHAFMGIRNIIEMEEKYLPKEEYEKRMKESLAGEKYYKH